MWCLGSGGGMNHFLYISPRKKYWPPNIPKTLIRFWFPPPQGIGLSVGVGLVRLIKTLTLY